MSKDRDDRYQTMEEMVQGLTGAVKVSDSGSRSAEAPGQLISRLVSTILKRHRMRLVLGGGILLAAAAIVAFLRFHESSASLPANRSLGVLPFAIIGD